MKRVAVSPLWVVTLSSLWMALVGNGALWRKLGELSMLDGLGGAAFGLGMLVMIWGALAALLGALAWRLTLKPAVTALLLATAAMSYFMWGYRVVIDPTMIDNLLQTDVREASGLFSVKMLLSLALFALLPIWLLWRQPVNYGGLRRQLLRNPLVAVSALCMMLIAAVAIFQPMASLMRNHKEVRYLINPLNGVYSLARVALRPLERNDSVLVPVGEDARLGRSHAGRARPPLLLLVLGETARSANFSINGYARPTTPEMERAQAASFRNAWSCGTSTAASVPCMFSNLTRDKFEDRKTAFEGLLDVLQRAGLAVLWVDNQSGCKGVCARVPTVSTADLKDPKFCASGECLDEIMLQGLEDRIAALDAARRARGVVVVLHQMGSHGPAYYRRSPKSFKRFMPECTSSALQDCSRDSVINAYDNTIVYTDHFLGQTIDWLKRQQATADTAMVYVSDHGESLGENNLYLHGLPYAVAPDVQKKVPWVTWLSPGYEKTTGLTTACLRGRRDAEVSHDNYFHSVLGLMDVSTAAYQVGMDAYAPCRPGLR
ncbi:MAG: phosphoethanolamine--lipid A transferase [Burkholderiaceae bacterium]|nr:phosphoethanolamine--lipid A transferase [Burkholderiaceae bacterium]MDO9089938.1 phosphoethanolamine--lipid A transferase [Burkholderiaceae bacterium]